VEHNTREVIMTTILKFVSIGAFCAAVSGGLTTAADLPKEGTYDFTACYSGTANPIVFSNATAAVGYEHSGTIISSPPGGMFDKGTFHCVGLRTSLGGKNANTTVCEVAFPDGDKLLNVFALGSDSKTTREAVAGTGKFEGIVSSGTVVGLGPFPVVKAGTYQDCNHQTGTYKLKAAQLH
jgi:hypothetical protein